MTNEIVEEIVALRKARKSMAAAAQREFASWMKSEMVAKKVSQIDLAGQLEASANTVWRLANGFNARFNTMAEVAATLGYRLRLVFEPIFDSPAHAF